AHVERPGEVDEAAAFVEVLLARGRLLLVHVRGRAEADDDQVLRGEVAPGVGDARARERGYLRQVHLTGDAAQLDAGVAQSCGLVEHLGPGPLGASERR